MKKCYYCNKDTQGAIIEEVSQFDDENGEMKE